MPAKNPSKRALENVQRAQNPGKRPAQSLEIANEVATSATDTSTNIMEPGGTPATDSPAIVLEVDAVSTTAHGGTTASGGKKSAQSDDFPAQLS